MTRPNRVPNYAAEVVSRWKQSNNEPVDVAENIENAVGNIIWNVTFGVTQPFDNDIVPEFRQLLVDVSPAMAGPHMMFVNQFPVLRKLDFLFGRKVQKVQGLTNEINRMVRDAVKLTEQSYDPDNEPCSYVEAFLREIKKNQDADKPIGNFHYAQLQASASGIWGAGFDTTVGLLRMCCLQLVNYPDVQRKLQQEIDAIGDRVSRIYRKLLVRYDDQKLLPYTCAFLQEVYRLTNVLPINFIRMTTQDTKIEGFPIQKGTNILPQFSMIHFDPDEFERPDYFCPERHDPRITPFSVGKRACLGETLARMEIFVMLATFVQNCHFTPVGKVPPAVEFDNGFTRLAKHFMVKIEPRI